jgi:hypothetical protein
MSVSDWSGIQTNDTTYDRRISHTNDLLEGNNDIQLPASLWSDDVEKKSSPENMPAANGSASGFGMTQEEKKQAALQTIAHLQEWALKNNISSNGVRVNGGFQTNGNGVSRPSFTIEQQIQLQNIQSQQQQQQLRQAEVLQRIVQDYLRGKQLNVHEQHLLHQYIQQQQRKQMLSNGAYHLSQQQQGYQGVSRSGDYAQQYQGLGSLTPDMARYHQDRLATAVTNGNNQSRISQMQMDALLALQRQQNMYPQNKPTVSMDTRRAGMPQSDSWQQGMSGTEYAYTGAQSSYIPARTANQYNTGSAYVSSQNGRTGVASMSQQGLAGARPTTGADSRTNGITNPIHTLQEIGKTLFNLGISVEGAVNAGLLGGLSASDVRVVVEAYRIESDLRSRRTAPVYAQRQSFAPSAPRNFTSMADSSTYGNQSAPNPSSPAGSTGNLSTGSLPVNLTRLPKSPTSKSTSVADENDSLLDQIVGTDTPELPKVSEEAIHAKVNDSAVSSFDAAQYGFFGDSSAEQDALESLENYHNQADEAEDTNDDRLLKHLSELKLGTGF